MSHPSFNRSLLTFRLDDEIYNHTMEFFPELSVDNHAKLTKLDEEWMKSEDGKNRWRTFINA